MYEEFDEISLDHFEGDLIGLVDNQRAAVIPVRLPSLSVSMDDEGPCLTLIDDKGAHYRYRKMLGSQGEVDKVVATFSTVFEHAIQRARGLTVTAVASDIPYTSPEGLVVSISVHRRWLTPRHDSWLYFIHADRPDQGWQGFWLVVKKERVPFVEDADRVATTEAIDEVRRQLDAITGKDGHPTLLTTSASDDWTLLWSRFAPDLTSRP
jgi:hypothetical protein